MVSKEEVGRRIRRFGEARFSSMAEFARQLGMKSAQHLYVYLRGKAYPGFELLDRLRRLGLDMRSLMEDLPPSPEPVVAEEREEYRLDERLHFRSEEEKKSVEDAVNWILYISRSYVDFSDEPTIKVLRRILLEAELKRYRRYGSAEFRNFVSKWKSEQEKE